MPWIVAACATLACSRQDAGWEDARRQDSLAAYQAYLERFPAGRHAEEARAALADLRDEESWSRAERLATPEAWQRYLGDFPDGRHAEAARRRLIEFIPSRPPPADGRYVVQLGAWSTEDAARAGLARADAGHRELLSGVEVRIVEPTDPPDAIWRVRTRALAEQSARDLCATLRSGGIDCVPLPAGSAGETAP